MCTLDQVSGYHQVALRRSSGALPTVYVARRVPSWRFWVQANATIIVNEHDVVVVDGGGFPAHVENEIGEIREITDKPVSVVAPLAFEGDLRRRADLGFQTSFDTISSKPTLWSRSSRPIRGCGRSGTS